MVCGMLDKQRIGTFILGGIAGALAGILLAPKSGREVRGSIASRAGEARERGRETYFEAQERMQERLARARERSPRSKETLTEGAAADPLPKLGQPVVPEPVLGPGPPVGASAEALPDPPLLRDVSQDVLSRDAPRTLAGEDPNPEEIRRRIRETRSRLRARLDTPRPEDTPGDRDG